MKFTALGIEGAWLAESPVWADQRGCFREWFKAEEIYATTGILFPIQQANFSQSQRGVIRGIHYSLTPLGQVKWITCISGSINDVIVDLRPNSPTFKKAEYVHLTPESGFSILIGTGLGHGFESLEDNSAVAYLLSSKYSPEHEFGINPFDVGLSLNWKVSEGEAILSQKDLEAPSLQSAYSKKFLPAI